ncbi:hypothetical protein CU097_012180 [Rhizopus azygosporus]|uniref:Uncharacterized protein n=1 Tax=Rhizopus azygosporus TaxID=86630 RepID=A0A367JJS1_RHIAZ|nr:hypothetical protein CU097_012180 [Rhizopus azygosporus]
MIYMRCLQCPLFENGQFDFSCKKKHIVSIIQRTVALILFKPFVVAIEIIEGELGMNMNIPEQEIEDGSRITKTA